MGNSIVDVLLEGELTPIFLECEFFAPFIHVNTANFLYFFVDDVDTAVFKSEEGADLTMVGRDVVGGSSFGTVETAPPCTEHAQEQVRHDALALLALTLGQVEVECVRELSQFKS